jgi:hypothetical protein
MKFLWLMLAACFLTTCEYTEVKREVGYKGKARVNPWLAAERFAARYDHEVRSLGSWTAPDGGDLVWFVPASLLGNQSFTRRMQDWVEDGGHLVLLVEHADTETNDWSRNTIEPRLEPALVEMLRRMGILLKEGGSSETPVTASKVEFAGNSFEVSAKSTCSVSVHGGAPGVFASLKRGDGRITVITDARVFRNRWIGEKEHAGLLAALIEATEFEGAVGFLRGSGLSLWGLLGNHLWPVLVGLGLLILLWLWKNLSRFGPLEAAEGVSPLRGYEHHLEALGDFQWRLDRAAALLAPLRTQILERGQRVSARSGRSDDEFFQFLADRAELPRERVSRALAESAPPDSFTLARTTADLQKLLQVLH